MTEAMWAQMLAEADAKGLKGGNFKKLNLPFENRLLGQPAEIRDRMVKRVEGFVYNMLTTVFNAGDTAQLAIEAILAAGSHDAGAKTGRIENPDEWTIKKYIARAETINSDKGETGDFDD